MDISGDHQFILALIGLIGLIIIILRSMAYAEKRAERDYFKDLVDKGYEMIGDDEEDDEDEDIISPDNSDKGNIDDTSTDDVDKW